MVPRPNMVADFEYAYAQSPPDDDSDSDSSVSTIASHPQQSGMDAPARKQHCAVSTVPDDSSCPARNPLAVLVFLDMLAVALVVPLLSQYFQQAGFTRASQREGLSLVFLVAQMVGGVVLVASSAKRRLLLSLAGSCVSYALLVWDRPAVLWCSRLAIGLVKQTMTVATTLATTTTRQANDSSTRSNNSCSDSSTSSQPPHASLGQLTAASTVAWMIGPALGAFLFQHVHVKAPPVLASIILAVTFVWAWIFVPETVPEKNGEHHITRERPAADTVYHEKRPKHAWFHLQSCFSSRALASVVLVRLLLTWVVQTTNCSQLVHFYQDMYGLEPHQRGYVSSYQQFLQFLVVQSSLVTEIVQWSSGPDERWVVCFFVTLLALVRMVESVARSRLFFLMIVCPVTSLAFAVTYLAIQSLLTRVVAATETASSCKPTNTATAATVWAALDVWQNAVSVSVPFYRAVLFRVLNTTMEGDCDPPWSHDHDPDPQVWLWTGGLHWLVVAVLTIQLLSWSSSTPHHPTTEAKKVL